MSPEGQSQEVGPVNTQEVGIPRFTASLVEETKHQIAVIKTMVKETLVNGIDYGRLPGSPTDGLWDPGAHTIMDGFNVYAGPRRILSLVDDDERISVIIETPGINRKTGQVVATGIGCASTLETKFKYRWVPKDEALEVFDDENDLEKLRKKQGERNNQSVTLYRIPNPEYSELLHNVVKMAAKRSEVDLAQSLPAVSPALREMFDPKLQREGPRGPARGEIWTRFWGDVNRLGFTKEQAEAKLGVTSMKDWLSSGKTLDQAIGLFQEEAKKSQATPPATVHVPDVGTVATGTGEVIDSHVVKPADIDHQPEQAADAEKRGRGRPKKDPEPFKPTLGPPTITAEFNDFKAKVKAAGFNKDEFVKMFPNLKVLMYATGPALFVEAEKILQGAIARKAQAADPAANLDF